MRMYNCYAHVHQLSELFKQHREQAQWLLLSALLILAIGLGALLWQKIHSAFGVACQHGPNDHVCDSSMAGCRD